MIKVVLIERKSSILFFCLLVFVSCDLKQNYSSEMIKKIMPTYTITNKLIDDELRKIDNNTADFDASSDVFVLYIEKKENKNYAISITKTEFSFFKKYKSNYYFKTLKGYADYNNKKVLIYGDVQNDLLKKTNEKLIDIMYYQRSEDTEEAPIIYEPTFINFTVK